MNRITSCLIVFIITCDCILTKDISELEVLSSQPSRCSYAHAYDMYGAHCAGLGLSNIPRLRGGIEILDFSDNKLRELHATTLSSYTSIKFLYLAENQIYLIDDDALTSLTDLQTLDLTKNVILDLPNSIFQLPSLRKLYLSGNPLFHITTDLTITRPIKAPLELLDLSDCKIRELPNWGILPQLIFYNISHNPLLFLRADHFAVMCNLGKVDLTGSIDKIRLCDIKPSIVWLKDKRIYFQLEDYSTLNSQTFENCPVTEGLSEMLNVTHRKCKSEFLQVQNIKASRRTWLTIGGGLAGFLVGFILLLYVMHRHNVAQTKSSSVKIKKDNVPNNDKHASKMLLNNES